MARETRPGRLGARTRELASTPARPATARVVAARLAEAERRGRGAAERRTPAATAPAAIPFEFGAVAVQAGGVGGPGAASEGPAVALPRPELQRKELGQRPPPLAAAALAAAPEVPAAAAPTEEAAALPVTPVAATPAAPAAEVAPEPKAAPPGRPRDALDAEPAAGRAAPALSPAAWRHVFRGLDAVADALLARIDASRAERPPTPAAPAPAGPAAGGARPPALAPGPDPAAAWRGRLEALRALAAELGGWSSEARLAAASVQERPAAAGALPFGAEAARIGQAARVIGATLAIVRAARAAARGGPGVRPDAAAERLGLRWAALDGLLRQLRAGTPVPGSAVEATVAAAHAEAQALLGPGGRLARAGVAALFSAAEEIGSALDEAAQRPAAAEAKGAVAASPVEARLERAAATVAAEPLVAPAPPVEARARALREEGRAPEPPEPDREKPPVTGPRPRPATWELHVPPAAREVRLEAIAEALGVARLADVRDVLREGLATRHQFVLWTRVETALASEVQALVDEGLVETRVRGP